MIRLLMIIAFLTITTSISAQSSPTPPNLYDTIARMDSLLFSALNTRDLEKIKTFFWEDVEFYHDKGGLQDYARVIENTKNMFGQENPPIRTLVKGSMEVYPIKDFGAVESGSHTFCHNENGRQNCGTFKFFHYWEKRNGQWKLKRIFSFNH